jgi:tRNA(Ile)-lysidine synthase
MLDEIKNILAEECRVDANRALVVGVSGGPDSLCLLDILARLGFSLVVVHLDHGLRAESIDEARCVATSAEALGIPFEHKRVDTRAYAAQNNLSIEEAARILRYRFLFETADHYEAQAVATGHTADDQVETVLMHLLRGAGLAGLRGMAFYSLPNAWSEKIPLVRPLLGIWRDEIDAHLETRDLRPAQDPTNLDTRFFRNRLRHELIPILEGYNSGVKDHLWRMARLLSDDYAVLAQMTEDAWQRTVHNEGEEFLSFDAPGLLGYPPAIQRQLIRRAILELRPDLRDIDYASIERARHFLASPSASRQVDLIGGLRLTMHGQRLYLAGWEVELPNEGADFWPGLSQSQMVALPIPGNVYLSGGWLLSTQRASVDTVTFPRALDNKDPYQAWIDADQLPASLQVRRRQPGDRFQPLGMGGHSIKLSDFMINIRLPAKARTEWPLVVAGEQIVWLPGLRLAHPFRLNQGSRRVIHLSLAKI